MQHLTRFEPAPARPGEPGHLAPLARLLPRIAIRFALILFAFTTLGCGDSTKPQAIWCETGTGPAEVVYPRAITYDRATDTYYVIDRGAHAQRLDRNGHCLCDWELPWTGGGREGPLCSGVAPDGNLYVPDTHNHNVLIYSPNGKLLGSFGSEGKGDGQFLLPTGIAFDHGRIFICEYGGNDRVQVFDLHWHKLFQFGRWGNGDGEFSRPEMMVIDNGLVYLTDACNHRIDVFTTEGKWVRNMGSTGSGLGQFRFPYGLAEDSEGHLIVTEFGNNRVQMIDKQTGRGLKTWGTAGRQPGELAYPYAAAVDKDDRVVVVDSGNNRLQVFSF